MFYRRHSDTRNNITQDRYRIFVQPSVFSLSSSAKKSIYMGIQFKDNEWGEGDKNEYLKNCFLLGCKLYDIEIEYFDSSLLDNIQTFPITIFKSDDFIFTFEPLSKKFKCPVCLLGDSIAGVHFFSGTGVNFGINSAIKVTDRESITLLTNPNFDNHLSTIYSTYNPLDGIDTILDSSYNVSLKYDIISIEDIQEIKEMCVETVTTLNIDNAEFISKIINIIIDSDNKFILLGLYYFLQSIG
jgi:hypothetical protein